MRLGTLALRLVLPTDLDATKQRGSDSSGSFYRSWMYPTSNTGHNTRLSDRMEPPGSSMPAYPILATWHSVGAVPPAKPDAPANGTETRPAASEPDRRLPHPDHVDGMYAGPCLRWLHQTGPAEWSRLASMPPPTAGPGIRQENEAAGVHQAGDIAPGASGSGSGSDRAG